MLVEQGMYFRPEWEKVISAVIDQAMRRSDVDPSKIVLIGESWGGYLAPRGAAFDKRVALCVLDPAQISLFRVMLSRLPLPARLKSQLPHGPQWLVLLVRALMSRFASQPTAGWALRWDMLTHGKATACEYFVDATRYEQEDIIGDISCPTLVCDAENDDTSAFSEIFFDRLSCEKNYLRFTTTDGAGDHCVSGNRSLFHERVFNWIYERLEQIAGDIVLTSGIRRISVSPHG